MRKKWKMTYREVVLNNVFVSNGVLIVSMMDGPYLFSASALSRCRAAKAQEDHEVWYTGHVVPNPGDSSLSCLPANSC